MCFLLCLCGPALVFNWTIVFKSSSSQTQNQTFDLTIDEFKGKNFSDFKNKLAEVLVEKIYPISNETNKLLKDEKFIDQILLDGSKKAEVIAKKKVYDLKNIIGF